MGKIDRAATTDFTDESKLIWFRSAPSYSLSYGEAIGLIEDAEKTIAAYRAQLAAQHLARIQAEEELAEFAAQIAALTGRHTRPDSKPEQSPKCFKRPSRRGPQRVAA